MNLFTYFKQYVRTALDRYVLAVGLELGAAAGSIAFSFAISQLAKAWVENGANLKAIWLGAAMVSVGIWWLLEGFAEKNRRYFAAGFIRQVRRHAFERFIFDLRGNAAQRIPQLRWYADWKAMERACRLVGLRLWGDAVRIAILGGMALWLAPALGLWMAIGMAIGGIAAWMMGKQVYAAFRSRIRKRIALANFVMGRSQAAPTLQVFNLQVPEQKRFSKMNETLHEANLRQAAAEGLYRPFIAIWPAAWLLFALGIDLALGEGALTPQGPEMLQALVFLFALRPSLQRALMAYRHFTWATMSFESAFGPVKNHPKAEKPLPQTAAGRVFPGSEEILATLRPGDHLVMVMDPTQSAQWCDELAGLTGEQAELSPERLKNLRKRFAIASAHYPFVGKTVAEAVSYSHDAESLQLAEKLVSTLLLRFPQAGFTAQSIMGNGPVFSLARTQTLLALCRALLRNKSILILNQPQAGLTVQEWECLYAWLRPLLAQKAVLELRPTEAGINLSVPSQILSA